MILDSEGNGERIDFIQCWFIPIRRTIFVKSISNMHSTNCRDILSKISVRRTN